MKKNKIFLVFSTLLLVFALLIVPFNTNSKKVNAMGGFGESFYHGVIPFSRVYYYADNGYTYQLTFNNTIPDYASPKLETYNGLRVRLTFNSQKNLTSTISFDSFQVAEYEDSELYVETSNPFLIEFSNGVPFVNISFLPSGFSVSSYVSYAVNGTNGLVDYYNTFEINDNTSTNFIESIFPSTVYNLNNDILVYECSLRFTGYIVDTYLDTPIVISQDTYVNLEGYDFSDFTVVVYDDVNLFESLITSVNGFLQIEILPEISFMDILVLVLVIPLLIMILKVWLGG